MKSLLLAIVSFAFLAPSWADQRPLTLKNEPCFYFGADDVDEELDRIYVNGKCASAEAQLLISGYEVDGARNWFASDEVYYGFRVDLERKLLASVDSATVDQAYLAYQQAGRVDPYSLSQPPRNPVKGTGETVTIAYAIPKGLIYQLKYPNAPEMPRRMMVTRRLHPNDRVIEVKVFDLPKENGGY